jgi:hypothetical protein
VILVETAMMNQSTSNRSTIASTRAMPPMMNINLSSAIGESALKRTCDDSKESRETFCPSMTQNQKISSKV